MKNFSYNKEASFIRSVKEPEKKKRSWNFDRFLFILVLLILTFFVGRYFYRQLVLVEADGQISFEKLDVHFTDDIRIKDYMVSEGDSIHKGDTLFRYVNKVFENSGGDYISFQKAQTEAKSRKQKLEMEAEFQKASISNYRDLLYLKRKQKKEAVNLVLLDVYDRSKVESLTNEIRELVLKIRNEKLELSSIENQIEMINQEMGTGDYNTSGKGAQTAAMESYYISPIAGKIGQIHFTPNEICYEEKNVLTIHKLEKVRIRAYFYQETMKDIKIGDRVKVRFPDGGSSVGVISDFFISTYELPKEFQKKYAPTERSILADVVPLNAQEEDLWRRYYKMDVKVTRNKLLAFYE